MRRPNGSYLKLNAPVLLTLGPSHLCIETLIAFERILLSSPISSCNRRRYSPGPTVDAKACEGHTDDFRRAQSRSTGERRAVSDRFPSTLVKVSHSLVLLPLGRLKGAQYSSTLAPVFGDNAVKEMDGNALALTFPCNSISTETTGRSAFSLQCRSGVAIRHFTIDSCSAVYSRPAPIALRAGQ